MIEGTSTATSNYLNCLCPCFCLVVFDVKANHFALVINESDEGKNTKIYGPGFHKLSYFNSV